MNSLEMAQYIAQTMYTDEFCAICGFAIKVDVPKTSVWEDIYGKKVLRSVHEDCYLCWMAENSHVKEH